MADYQSVVTGSSKEAVAYALMLGIAQHQDKLAYPGGTVVANADEKWIFETYAKCLRIAGGTPAGAVG